MVRFDEFEATAVTFGLTVRPAYVFAPLKVTVELPVPLVLLSVRPLELLVVTGPVKLIVPPLTC